MSGHDGGRWGTRHSSRPHQLQAVIDTSRALLDSGSHESAKGLLRAFSGDLVNGWPKDDQEPESIGWYALDTEHRVNSQGPLRNEIANGPGPTPFDTRAQHRGVPTLGCARIWMGALWDAGE